MSYENLPLRRSVDNISQYNDLKSSISSKLNKDEYPIKIVNKGLDKDVRYYSGDDLFDQLFTRPKHRQKVIKFFFFLFTKYLTIPHTKCNQYYEMHNHGERYKVNSYNDQEYNKELRRSGKINPEVISKRIYSDMVIDNHKNKVRTLNRAR